MDAGNVTGLTLLDLSTALDRLSHWEDLMIGSGLLGKHSIGLNHIWLEDARRLSRVTVCPPKLISLLESLKGQFKVLCFSPSIPLQWEAWSLDTLSLTISMLVIASCMVSFLHQGTLLRHWMVYSHAWPLSSHECRWINWNWTQIKVNSFLLGTNGSGANTSLCFLLSFLVSNLIQKNLLGSLK